MDSHHHQSDDDLEPLEEDADLEPEEGNPDEDEQQDEPPPMHAAAGPDFYQRQMHLQNRRDIQKLQSGHSKIMNLLTKVVENTKDLPSIKEDVDELKEGRAKVKGAMWIVGIGTPLFTWLASRVFKF